LEGGDVWGGGSKDLEVPKNITKLNWVVFDIEPHPLTPTIFTLKDSLGNVLATFEASVNNVMEVLSWDRTNDLPGGTKLVLSWPPFTYACATQLPPGKQPRVLVFLQFYEDPGVVNAEQQALDNRPLPVRWKGTTLGTQ
jgi:hypothetical protein